MRLVVEGGSGAYYDVCEHPDFKLDAKRASLYNVLEVKEGLGVIITYILYHLAEELYLTGGE